MKAFRFPLERVLEWRARQVEIEEARLQALALEREGLAQRAADLEREVEEARRSVMAAGSPAVEELLALDRFHRYAVSQRARLAAATKDCEKRMAEQRTRVAEARRRQELLARLRQRRRAEWQAAFDREQDDLAAELHLAKIANRKPPARTSPPGGAGEVVQAAVQPPSIESTWPWAYPASSEHT